MTTAFNSYVSSRLEESFRMNQSPDSPPVAAPHDNDAGLTAELVQIREALRGLRYGTVSIIIQDGVVVQIDRLEKRRVRRSDQRGPQSANGSRQ